MSPTGQSRRFVRQRAQKLTCRVLSDDVAGQTTVDQLKAIQEKIVALLKGEDAHVLIVSKLSDIAKGHEKRKQAAMDAASKKEDPEIKRKCWAADIGYGRFMNRKSTSDTARGTSELRPPHTLRLGVAFISSGRSSAKSFVGSPCRQKGAVPSPAFARSIMQCNALSCYVFLRKPRDDCIQMTGKTSAHAVGRRTGGRSSQNGRPSSVLRLPIQPKREPTLPARRSYGESRNFVDDETVGAGRSACSLPPSQREIARLSL